MLSKYAKKVRKDIDNESIKKISLKFQKCIHLKKIIP